MKKLFAITTVVVLCSALFFVVVSPAAETIPFDGKWQGKSYVFWNVDYCPQGFPLAFISIGKGVSSIMGGVNWFGMVCLDQQITNGTGTAIVSKPNGDAIYLDIDLILKGDNTWTQTENIVGGAGRFLRATGSSVSNGIAELDLLTFTGSWSGTNVGSITLP